MKHEPSQYHNHIHIASQFVSTFYRDSLHKATVDTSNKEISTYCREQFNSELPSVILARHTSLFLDELRHCDKYLIKNVMRT